MNLLQVVILATYLQALLGLLNNVHVGMNFTYLNRGTVKKSFISCAPAVSQTLNLPNFYCPAQETKSRLLQVCML